MTSAETVALSPSGVPCWTISPASRMAISSPELVGFLEVLSGEEEGDAVLAVESLDVLPEVLPGDGVEAGGGLVEEDDRGRVDEGGGGGRVGAACRRSSRRCVGRRLRSGRRRRGGGRYGLRFRRGARCRAETAGGGVLGRSGGCRVRLPAGRRRLRGGSGGPGRGRRSRRRGASPAVGRRRVVSMRTVVVLPLPFCPRKPKICPGRTRRSMPLTAWMSPKCLTRPWASIARSGSRSCCGAGAAI